MGMRGSQNENYVRGRLFQGFEQGIEGCRAELVDLVDNVHLKASRNGRKMHLVDDEVANFLHLSVGRGIDLEHVETGPLRDLPAKGAFVAGIITRPALAIQSLGKYTSGTGFTRTPRATEEIGTSRGAAAQNIAQSLNDRFLADQILETLRTPFAKQGNR